MVEHAPDRAADAERAEAALVAGYSGMSCSDLDTKIKNLKKEVSKRSEELKENPLNLPKTCPGDRQSPSRSVMGHVMLLNLLKMQLAFAQGIYAAKGCGEPPTGTAPVTTTTTVAVVAAIMIMIMAGIAAQGALVP